MRRPLLIGNWKMNTSLDDALELARVSAASADRVQTSLDVGICPPFPWIVPVADLVRRSSLIIGAQDVSPESDGAFTGDVSAAMLSCCCRFVLIGHSERRTIHGESDEVVARKLRSARDQGLGVVLCIGETASQRESGQAESIVTNQLRKALSESEATDIEHITVAYEPVWAIGSGQAATRADAQRMCAAIREWLAMNHRGTGDGVRLLYGGSVSVQNVREFLEAPDIDGALVGSASLDPERFAGLVNAATGTT